MGAIFNDELKRLRGHFMEMGIDASEQIYQATKAFTESDTVLAEQVLKTDPKINDEEINLEKEALKLMALAVHSPLPKVIEPESSARKMSTATEPLSVTASVSKTKPALFFKARVWLTEVKLLEI